MGVLLLIVGLAVLGFGAWNHLKGKRILAAPFQKTGEIAKNPVSTDPKGAMSTEGKVIAPAVTLLSPCTQQPCLSYEVKIERMYEKTETTQDGTKTVKGTSTLETLKGGAVFGLDDGSGVLMIDVSKGADFDNYKEGFKKELNGHSGSSHIQFGELTFDVPVIGSDSGWTTGFKATEKFVPVEGNLFVLGKLEGASLVKPGWRAMMTSSKGRDGLLGSIQKKKKFSFIGGGVAAVLSIPAMIFAPAADPNEVSAHCESSLTDARQKCSDTVSSKSGESYTWTVSKPGKYKLTAFAPKKKVAFLPQLVLKDAAGVELADEMGDIGTDAVATVDVKAGTYELTVLPGDGYMVKGGFSFDLEIKSLDPKPAAAPVAGAKGAAPRAPVAAVGSITADQLTERVDSLNELCPDTFCEGQYNYDFKKLDCADDSHCTLSFVAKDSDHPKLAAKNAQVEVTGFTALVQDPEKDFVYEGSFDEKVGEALAAWEMNPKSAPKSGSIAAPTKTVAPVKVKAAVPAPTPVKKTEVVKPAPVKTVAVVKPAPVKTVAVVKPAPVKKVVAAPAPVAATATRSSNKNMAD